MLEVSVKVIERNESRLGLDVARRDINDHHVRYDAAIAEAALRERNQLPVEE